MEYLEMARSWPVSLPANLEFSAGRQGVSCSKHGIIMGSNQMWSNHAVEASMIRHMLEFHPRIAIRGLMPSVKREPHQEAIQVVLRESAFDRVQNARKLLGL